MKPVQESRVDVGELKGQILKRIGAERAKRYFYYFNRLLSQKLSKSEFDKLCCRVLGRENLPLHNQLVRSILKNACHAKALPPMYKAGPPKSMVVDEEVSSPIEDAHELNESIVPTQIQAPPSWSNGVVLPMSPRKVRSGLRDRKLRDRPCPLGPNGNVLSFSQQPAPTEDCCIKIIMENGEMAPCNYKKPLQNLPVTEQPENEREFLILHSANRQTINKSIDTPTSLRSKDQIGFVVVEDGEEMEQADYLNISTSPLLAPLGIPFCSASIGGVHKCVPMTRSGNFVSYSDSGGLSDTETLKKHMEQIAVAQGLGGVSIECANTMNNLVDVHLKRLIKSCVDLVKSRSAPEPRKQHAAPKQYVQPKLVNGLRTTNHYHMQSSVGLVKTVQKQSSCRSISLIDFKTAMELNPQQLGEDWPLLLEKICMHGFEE